MEQGLKYLLLLMLMFGIFFASCSTKIPSDVEIAKKTHIKENFSNVDEEAKSLNVSNLTQKKGALAQFGALINDKELIALLEIGLERNTNVLIMLSRIKQAKSQVKINTANMFPTINGSLNTNYTDRRTQNQAITIRPGTNSVNASVGLSWELDLFGKLNALRKSSKKAYDQAQSNLANAQISLIGEVASLYFTLRDNAHNLNLSKAMVENLKEIDEIAQVRYKQGLININDYKTIKANFIAQQNSYESLQYTYEQNKNALLVLLDINDADLIKKVDFLSNGAKSTQLANNNADDFTDSMLNSTKESKEYPYEIPKITTFEVNAIPAQVVLKRPDVQASIYALHSQLYKTTNAKVSQLPTISLSGSIGEVLYSNTGSGSLIYQIANSIAAPLLNRTSLRQNYLTQKELSNEAFYTLQSTINTAISEMENALFDKDSKRRQVQNNRAIFDIAKEAYDSDIIRAKSGMLDRSEFLSNQNSYYSLESQFFTSQINELISAVTLFKAFGGDLYFYADSVLLGERSTQSRDITQSTLAIPN